jgi:hypothetical protein
MFLRSLAAMFPLATFTLVGCTTSYLAVELDVSAKLSSSRSPLPKEFVTNPVDAPRASGAMFKGEAWTWTIGASGVAIGGGVTNSGSEPLCVEFQNATLFTDRGQEIRPWPSTAAVLRLGGEIQRIGVGRPNEPVTLLNEVCIAPNQQLSYVIYLDPKKVSDADQLFGARRGPDMETSVRGRSMQIGVPIRVGSRADRVQFDLKAKSAFLKTTSF